MSEAASAAPAADDFREAVLIGLGRTPKSVPSKYLYDARGSALFDSICEQPEYYPTRVETAILKAEADGIAAALGPGVALVEFGSGSSVKVRILLDALEAPAAYVPVDISAEHLEAAARDLAADYPNLPVRPVAADYTKPFSLPDDVPGRRAAFFPGSTIGNFEPEEAADFLAGSTRLLGPGGDLLIGADTVKDTATLNAAYNDAAGVTAAFSLNLLERINRELGADLDPARFAHDAAYNPERRRIEIGLRSLRDQTAEVAGRRFAFGRGEIVQTERSYKYAVEDFRALARRAGLRPERAWTDEDGLFAVHHLRIA